MTEINEGQIYERKNGQKILITCSTPSRQKIIGIELEGFYSYITPTGYTNQIADCVIAGLKLVAEYKTWREAVISKDFLPLEAKR